MKLWLRRLLAAALLVGGCFGIGIMLANRTALLGQGGTVVALAVGWLVLFGAAVAAGVMLWRDAPGGRGFALALYALQIPVLVTSPLEWTWFTGINLAVQLAGAGRAFDLGINVHLGANGQFFLGGSVPVPAYGINLFALAALLLLLRGRRRSRDTSAGERRA